MWSMFARASIFGCLILSSTVVSIFGQTPMPGDTLRLGLEEAVRYALSVSPEIAQMEAKREFATARHDLAKSSRFLTEFNMTTAHAVAPTLSETDFGAKEAYLDPELRNDWSRLQPFNQVEFEILQPLYTWGQLGGSINAARYGTDAALAEVRDKAQQVAERTTEIYYNVLLAEELHRLVEETGNIVDEAKRQIRRLLDEGADDVDDADLFQVQIVEQEYLRRVVEVEQNRTLAQSALHRQLFLPEDVVLQVKDAVLTPLDYTLESLELYTARATGHRPELAQADAGLAARESLVQVARSNLYPKLFLGASTRLAYTPGRTRIPNPYISDRLIGRSLQIGLGVRFNLNFSQNRARIRQAEAERDEVKFQREGAYQLIQFEVEEAYRNLITAKAALDAQDAALQISKDWLRTEQINFDLELGDTENLVRAVQANLELQAQFYQAVQRYNLRVVRLLRTTGTLAERIQTGTLIDVNTF